MSTQNGVFSNLYTYQPLVDDETPYRQLAQIAGTALGQLMGGGGGPMGSQLGGTLGASSADALYQLASNASTIAANAQTFVQEVSDWRSWASMMSSISGGYLGR